MTIGPLTGRLITTSLGGLHLFFFSRIKKKIESLWRTDGLFKIKHVRARGLKRIAAQPVMAVSSTVFP
jgi:hypothetical protein